MARLRRLSVGTCLLFRESCTSYFPHIWQQQVSFDTIWAFMSDAAYYRAEAQRFLDWASKSADPVMARRWRRLADEYVTLAEQLDARQTGRAPLLRGPIQRQPVQQQQGKLGPDEPAEC